MTQYKSDLVADYMRRFDSPILRKIEQIGKMHPVGQKISNQLNIDVIVLSLAFLLFLSLVFVIVFGLNALSVLVCIIAPFVLKVDRAVLLGYFLIFALIHLLDVTVAQYLKRFTYLLYVIVKIGVLFYGIMAKKSLFSKVANIVAPSSQSTVDKLETVGAPEVEMEDIDDKED